MSATSFTLDELGLRSGDGSHEARVCADNEFMTEPCVLEINDLAALLFRTLRNSCQRGDVDLDLGPTHAENARDWQGLLAPLRRFVVGASAVTSSPQLPEELNLYGV